MCVILLSASDHILRSSRTSISRSYKRNSRKLIGRKSRLLRGPMHLSSSVRSQKLMQLSCSMCILIQVYYKRLSSPSEFLRCGLNFLHFGFRCPFVVYFCLLPLSIAGFDHLSLSPSEDMVDFVTICRYVYSKNQEALSGYSNSKESLQAQ